MASSIFLSSANIIFIESFFLTTILSSALMFGHRLGKTRLCAWRIYMSPPKMQHQIATSQFLFPSPAILHTLLGPPCSVPTQPSILACGSSSDNSAQPKSAFIAEKNYPAYNLQRLRMAYAEFSLASISGMRYVSMRAENRGLISHIAG